MIQKLSRRNVGIIHGYKVQFFASVLNLFGERSNGMILSFDT